MFSQIQRIFGPKNIPKTLPKRGPNPSKIDAENVLFFNIDFFGFWPAFWRVLGFQLGTKLALKASKKFSMVAHFYLLKLSVFKKLRLGGLRARFWRPPGSILEAPGLDFGGSGLDF